MILISVPSPRCPSLSPFRRSLALLLTCWSHGTVNSKFLATLACLHRLVFQHLLYNSFIVLKFWLQSKQVNGRTHTHTFYLALPPPLSNLAIRQETTLFVHIHIMCDEEIPSEISLSCRCPVNSVAGAHISRSGFI